MHSFCRGEPGNEASADLSLVCFFLGGGGVVARITILLLMLHEVSAELKE